MSGCFALVSFNKNLYIGSFQLVDNTLPPLFFLFLQEHWIHLGFQYRQDSFQNGFLYCSCSLFAQRGSEGHSFRSSLMPCFVYTYMVPLLFHFHNSTLLLFVCSSDRSFSTWNIHIHYYWNVCCEGTTNAAVSAHYYASQVWRTGAPRAGNFRFDMRALFSAVLGFILVSII